MGCRTGFYLIVRELSSKDTIALINETLEQAIAHTGEIPGAKKKECGNYLEHDLDGARAAMTKYYELLKDWAIYNVQYKNNG